MNISKQLSTLTGALLLTAFTSAHAAEWNNQVRLSLGTKQLDSDDWGQHDEHGSIGLLLDFKKQDWPASIAIDLFGTGDENHVGANSYEGYTGSAHIGLRKHYDLGQTAVTTYFGSGIALVFAEEESRTAGLASKDDDSGTGYWIGGGIDYDLSDHVTLGFDLRYSNAEVSLFNSDREIGGVLYGFTLGYQF